MPTIDDLRRERDRIQRLADRAARRVWQGDVKSPAYAQSLARQLENAEGDLARALWPETEERNHA